MQLLPGGSLGQGSNYFTDMSTSHASMAVVAILFLGDFLLLFRIHN